MQKVLLAVIAASIVTIGLTVNYSGASHEPADKTAGTASTVDELDDTKVLLTEKMRVSSTSDLILATTAECSILTALHTVGGGDVPSEQDGAFGQVELWLTIDGKRVPVASNSAGVGDNGEVVFCNRAYQRSVADMEDEPDGIDEENDFIRTRTANGFNWMAFNVGKVYDTGENNVVTVQLHGRYSRTVEEDGVPREDEAARCLEDADEDPDTEPTPIPPRDDDDLDPYSQTCAEAFVGKRSLIVEAVHASTHEQTTPE